MKKSFSVSLNHLKPLGDSDIEQLEEIFREMEYHDEQGYGFRNTKLKSQYLQSTLVKRTPTFLPQFDVASGEFVEQEFFLFSETEFAIDARYELLEIFGPVKQAPKVRTAVRPLLNTDTRLSSVNLSPTKVIQQLLPISDTIQIENLTINNFQYREGIVGRYSIKQIEAGVAETLMQNYNYDIVRGTISVLLSDFDVFTLQISNNGSLRIICEEIEFTEIFSYLKSFQFIEEV